MGITKAGAQIKQSSSLAVGSDRQNDCELAQEKSDQN